MPGAEEICLLGLTSSSFCGIPQAGRLRCAKTFYVNRCRTQRLVLQIFIGAVDGRENGPVDTLDVGIDHHGVGGAGHSLQAGFDGVGGAQLFLRTFWVRRES